jgi:2-aminoadipate transaminase
MDDGHYDRQVVTLIDAYRRKRDVVLEALDEYLGPIDEAISWTRPRGGIYVWLTLPEGIDAGRDGPLFGRCLEQGVLYVPGVYAYPDEPGPAPTNHARLSFGVPSEAGLVEGVRRLAAALEGCLDPIS